MPTELTLSRRRSHLDPSFQFCILEQQKDKAALLLLILLMFDILSITFVTIKTSVFRFFQLQRFLLHAIIINVRLLPPREVWGFKIQTITFSHWVLKPSLKAYSRYWKVLMSIGWSENTVNWDDKNGTLELIWPAFNAIAVVFSILFPIGHKERLLQSKQYVPIVELR